jgi:predicted DNA-binding transcriptional regulator AlpA
MLETNLNDRRDELDLLVGKNAVLLTADEVAEILHVDRKRIYELPIPAVRLSPRTLRYRTDDVNEFIRARQEGRVQ